jgi:hypothetical protein
VLATLVSLASLVLLLAGQNPPPSPAATVTATPAAVATPEATPAPVGPLNTAAPVPTPGAATAAPLAAHDPSADLLPGSIVTITDPVTHQIRFVGAMDGHCNIIAGPGFSQKTARMVVSAQFSPDLYCAGRDRALQEMKEGPLP